MQKTLLILASLFLSVSCSFHPYKKAKYQLGEPLFRVCRDGRWGFINRSGAEVIEPKFRDASSFSDSLAAVRLNGRWGFINPEGAFVIQPTYDYALSFSEGYAAVWEAGKPTFINAKGEKPFVLPDSTLNINFFMDGKAEFSAMKNGEPIIFSLDTSGNLKQLEEGESWQDYPLVISREKSVAGLDYPLTEYAVKDSTGKIVVPFGRYKKMEPFHHGFAEITIDRPEIDDEQHGIINERGKVIFLLPVGSYVSHAYSEGLLTVSTQNDPNDWNAGHFISWYDTTGKVVLSKRDVESACSFINGKTFSRNKDGWYIMDKNGNTVGKHRFETVPDQGFSNGIAEVSVTNAFAVYPYATKYGIVDTNGNYVITPEFSMIHNAGFQEEGLLVAMREFRQKDAAGNSPTQEIWGLVDRKGAWIFPTQFTFVDRQGYQNGLLYAEIDSLYGYVDPKGKFVWSAIRQKDFPKPEALNSDCMLRAYCYGLSSKDKLTHPPEDNFERNYARPGAFIRGFKEGHPGVVVKTDEPARFKEKYTGITAYVYNAGTDTLEIDVQDSRLYLVMQALNPKGEWQDIEYCPSSWCGNSYYDTNLNPDEFLKFTIPVHDGDLPATLRMAFTWKRKWKKGQLETKTVYSNTFSGKINPGQFWRQQGHIPMNIMDPYVN